jgi:transposase, IS6 family
LGLSDRDVKELLAKRGVKVDHGTQRPLGAWVQRFTPLLADAARPCRHRVAARWQVDQTHGKAAGRWRPVDPAIHQVGQVVDASVSPRRDRKPARRCLEQAIGTTKLTPVEVVPDPRRCGRACAQCWHRQPGIEPPVRQQPGRDGPRPVAGASWADAGRKQDLAPGS